MTTMVGLYVEYKAKTQEIDAAFKKMEREIKNLKDKQTSVNQGFSSIGNTIKKVFAAGAVIYFAKQLADGFSNAIGWINKTAEAIDDVSKAAGTLGIAVSSLQKLQYVASLAGVTNEELEKSFRKMSMTLGKAFTGQNTTQLTSAFSAMKLSLNDIKGLDADQQYIKIADAIGKISDKNIQAAAAAAIFGKGYTGILKMIRQGVGDTTKEFDKMGLALTDSQAQAVEAFNDAQTRLGAIWSGFSQKVVAFVAPAFEKIISYVGEAIMSFGGMDKAANSFAKAMLTSIQFMLSGFDVFLTVLDQVRNRIDQIITGVGNAMQRVRMVHQFLVNAVSGAGTSVDPGMIGQLNPVDTAPTSSMGGSLSTIQDILAQANATMDTLESVIPPINKLSTATDMAADSIVKSGKKIDDFLSSMIKSEGQNKLREILGTNKNTDKAKQIDNPVWNQLIKDIYSKALNGTGGQIQTGTFNGKQVGFRTSTAAEDLAKLESGVTSVGRGGDVSGLTGYIGAIDELKAFLAKLDPNSNKVKVDIEVKTEEGFLLKVAQSAELQKQMQKEVLDIASKAARMGAK